MYNVVNRSDIYVTYNDNSERGIIGGRWHIKRLGDERAMVVFLAEGFWSLWNGEDSDGNESQCLINRRFGYYYCDGYGRRIDARPYYSEALDFYTGHIVTGLHVAPRSLPRWRLRYRYTFRQGNVECIRKRRGGPWVRSRRIMAGKRPYFDPVQRQYLRGSPGDYPDGWWDDWERCVERNWKSQRKVRHQWQR